MIELLRNRRSVRDFSPRSIEEEKLQILREALVRSPSSRSLNPWEFILVTDRGILADLALCKPHGASFLAGAPLGAVILGDTMRSDTCIEDCSIAAITLQYAAQSLGLSSCWCQVRLRSFSEGTPSEEYVRRLLDIPDHFLVECIIAVGYAASRERPHGVTELDWTKIRG
ncbi:MAG: nitroreductase family protein [Proteobacteria bacterium]|nr:nitroreductase family protein [Pseudomonadota bacterium]